MLSEIVQYIVYGCSAVVTLTTTGIAIYLKIKKAKATGESVALVVLNEIHELADGYMKNVENSNYSGQAKKELVIAKVLLQHPELDVEELGNYIDKQVHFSKEVNKRDKDLSKEG